jgi:hypothetical protein
LVDQWKDEVLFSTSQDGRWKKAKLRFTETYLEVETGVALGLMRATYKIEFDKLDGYSTVDGVLELQLRTADGLGQRWSVKTARVEELSSLLRSLHTPERLSSAAPQPAIVQPPPPPGQAAPPKPLSQSVKFALSPGRWTSAKITLTKDAMEISMFEFMGMMARPTKVVVELNALRSFSRSDGEILVLHVESRPGYGLGGDWYISSKQRDQWADVLLSLGIPETQLS